MFWASAVPENSVPKNSGTCSCALTLPVWVCLTPSQVLAEGPLLGPFPKAVPPSPIHPLAAPCWSPPQHPSPPSRSWFSWSGSLCEHWMGQHGTAFLGRRSGRSPETVTMSSSSNQNVTLRYVCFCLKTLHLIYTCPKKWSRFKPESELPSQRNCLAHLIPQTLECEHRARWPPEPSSAP